MARLTEEQAVCELAGVARALLLKYHESESNAIALYGEDDGREAAALDVECERVGKRINHLEWEALGHHAV